jgi:hypothetical protein
VLSENSPKKKKLQRQKYNNNYIHIYKSENAEECSLMYIKLCTHDRIFIGKTEMKIYGKWCRTIWKRISIIGEKSGPHVWL